MNKPDITTPSFLRPPVSDSDYIEYTSLYIQTFDRLNGLKPVTYWVRGVPIIK